MLEGSGILSSSRSADFLDFENHCRPIVPSGTPTKKLSKNGKVTFPIQDVSSSNKLDRALCTDTRSSQIVQTEISQKLMGTIEENYYLGGRLPKIGCISNNQLKAGTNVYSVQTNSLSSSRFRHNNEASRTLVQWSSGRELSSTEGPAKSRIQDFQTISVRDKSFDNILLPSSTKRTNGRNLPSQAEICSSMRGIYDKLTGEMSQHVSVSSQLEIHEPMARLLNAEPSDDLVFRQIQKNKILVQSMLDRHKRQVEESRQHKEFSNFSFVRNDPPARERPENLNGSQRTTKMGFQLSDTTEHPTDHPNLKSSLPTVLKFEYTSVTDQAAAAQVHPESIEELMAIAKAKEWKIPSLDCLDRLIFAHLGVFERRDLYDASFQTYKSSKEKTKGVDNQILKVSSEKVARYFRATKSVHRKIDSQVLLFWYCKMTDRIGKRTPEVQSKDLKALVSGESARELSVSKIRHVRSESTGMDPSPDYPTNLHHRLATQVYFLHGLVEQLRGVEKEMAEALGLAVRDIFNIVDEVTAFMDKFVSKLDDKRSHDIQIMESVYKEKLLEQEHQASFLKRELKKRDEDLAIHRRVLHNMKNKLSTEYSIICELRRDVEFQREYSRIIDVENDKITSTFKTLKEEMKELADQRDKFKLYAEQIIDYRAKTEEDKQLLQEKQCTPLKFTAKENYEHEKMLEDDNGVYDGFKTESKQTSTEDMVQETTLTIQFASVTRVKDVQHKKVQITMQKAPTKDAECQIDGDMGHIRLEQSNSSHVSDDGVLDNPYRSRVLDRLKLEHMVVGNQPQKKVLNRAPSLLMIPPVGTPSNSMEHSPREGYSRSNQKSIFEEPQTERKSTRFQVQSGNQTARASTRFLTDKNEGPYTTRAGRHSTVKSNFKHSGAGERFQTVARKVLSSQKTITHLRDLVSQTDFDNGERLGLAQSQAEIEGGEKLQYENMRENQLRNELIRQKQLYMTLSNRILIYNEDPKKTIELQANLDQVSNEILALEGQLKTLRKNTDLIDKLKQFKPATIVSKHLLINRKIFEYGSSG